MSLFWRQFFLIGSLIAASLIGWMVTSHILERGPRSQQVAWQIASAINLTRSAVVAAEPMRRPSLLAELARDEGVRISIAETTDTLAALDDTPDNRAIATRLRAIAGEKTRLVSAINGEPGFWVSFDIEGEGYWLGFAAKRFAPQGPKSLFGWAALVVLLALAAAVFITRLINEPLQRLAEGLSNLARGERPARLPEKRGASEIRALNQRFNLVSQELERVESDRAIALAGVSHDIRTPLTRMRIEIEMSPLQTATRQSLVDEIERINAIVSQFIDFSHSSSGGKFETFDVLSLITQVAQRGLQIAPEGSTLTLELAPQLNWAGSSMDLDRMLTNLIGNAARYGFKAGEPLELNITAHQLGKAIRIEVNDRGPGVPIEAQERLLRPFARLDEERSQAAGGSGLGLAIVARLARRYQGRVTLRNRPAPEGGLCAAVELEAPIALAN
jgi:two-component system, OmpR family, osmolarity sensor histidine kinase EnvZ